MRWYEPIRCQFDFLFQPFITHSVCANPSCLFLSFFLLSKYLTTLLPVINHILLACSHRLMHYNVSALSVKATFVYYPQESPLYLKDVALTINDGNLPIFLIIITILNVYTILISRIWPMFTPFITNRSSIWAMLNTELISKHTWPNHRFYSCVAQSP